MKWIEAKVVFDADDNRLAGELIANLFFEFDLQGVVEEDPAIETAEDWAEDSIGRAAQHAVIGYFPKDRQAQKRRRVLEEKLAVLKEHSVLLYRVRYKELDEEDWAEAWKVFFEPRESGKKLLSNPPGASTKPIPMISCWNWIPAWPLAPARTRPRPCVFV